MATRNDGGSIFSGCAVFLLSHNAQQLTVFVVQGSVDIVMSYVIWPPKSRLSWPSMGAGVWSLSKPVEALDEYFCPPTAPGGILKRERPQRVWMRRRKLRKTRAFPAK